MCPPLGTAVPLLRPGTAPWHLVLQGPIGHEYGKYGLIRETDMYSKRPEFQLWAMEVGGGVGGWGGGLGWGLGWGAGVGWGGGENVVL